MFFFSIQGNCFIHFKNKIFSFCGTHTHKMSSKDEEFFSKKSDALLKQHQDNLISLTKQIKEEIERYENEVLKLNHEIKNGRLRGLNL